jgi:chromosome segregation ATPase
MALEEFDRHQQGLKINNMEKDIIMIKNAQENNLQDIKELQDGLAAHHGRFRKNELDISEMKSSLAGVREASFRVEAAFNELHRVVVGDFSDGEWKGGLCSKMEIACEKLEAVAEAKKENRLRRWGIFETVVSGLLLAFSLGLPMFVYKVFSALEKIERAVK